MADDAEQLLSIQIAEMQSIGERMRAKLKALLLGEIAYASVFEQIWSQLTPEIRQQIITQATRTVQDTLPPPKHKYETLLHVTCPEFFMDDFATNKLDINRLILAVCNSKENDKSYFLYDTYSESIRLFLESHNYEVYDPFKGHRNNRAMTNKLTIENRKLWMVKFASNIVSEICAIVSQLEKQQQPQQESAAPTTSSSTSSTSSTSTSSTSTSSTSSIPFVDTQCRRCRKPEAASKCSRCKVVKYCTRECQVADWPAHKPTCCPPSK